MSADETKLPKCDVTRLSKVQAIRVVARSILVFAEQNRNLTDDEAAWLTLRGNELAELVRHDDERAVQPEGSTLSERIRQSPERASCIDALVTEANAERKEQPEDAPTMRPKDVPNWKPSGATPDEQALVNRLSPGYQGLNENGDETTALGSTMRAYYEGWNNAADEAARRIRLYHRDRKEQAYREVSDVVHVAALAYDEAEDREYHAQPDNLTTAESLARQHYAGLRAALESVLGRCEYVGCNRPGRHDTHTVSGVASVNPNER